MTVKPLKQSILSQRHNPLMVSLDDTGYYYTRHWNISSTMFVMLLRFVLCILLRFRKNTQLATVGTHQRFCWTFQNERTLVFKGPVRSGYWPILALTKTETG